MGCKERHMDITEGVREAMGDIRRYWNITE
jgi:hypothetical protein